MQAIPVCLFALSFLKVKNFIPIQMLFILKCFVRTGVAALFLTQALDKNTCGECRFLLIYGFVGEMFFIMLFSDLLMLFSYQSFPGGCQVTSAHLLSETRKHEDRAHPRNLQ